jgi:uncharacterized protein YuzB (UPF0349 family)
MMRKGNIMKTFTTKELVEQLYTNLRALAPENAESAYIAGYISGCLADIATKGIDELVAIVDFTNQQVEVLEYNRRAYDRRQKFENGEYA